MTLLFAGGEDTSFSAPGAAVGIRNSSEYRTQFARLSLSFQNSTTVADPPANRGVSPTFTSAAHIWFRATVNVINAISTTANQHGLIFRSPDGVSRIILRQTGTGGQLKASTRNAAGTITDLATATANLVLATNTELLVEINYVLSGAVNVWYNGVQVIAFSGDPRTDAATQLNQFDFANLNNGAATNSACQWSEFMVADQSLLGSALWTLVPQAAGATQSWTPNTLANINKANINDTTSISTPTNNALSQWTLPSSAPTGSYAVLGVVQEARVEVGATGPQHFDWSAHISAADYVGGASNAPTTSFGNFGNFIWATNPATSSAWGVSDITGGLQLGIKALA